MSETIVRRHRLNRSSKTTAPAPRTAGETRLDELDNDVAIVVDGTTAPATEPDDRSAAQLAAQTAAAVLPPPGYGAKRVLDLAVCAALAIVVLVVAPLIALLVWAEDRGPVLFKQERRGRNGRSFHLLKFRTMHTDAEARLHNDPALYAAFKANGYKLPSNQDPRITRIGRFLRSSSLDELPQLANVVRGDMSLVGPRPPLLDQIEELYGDQVDHYYAVRPGLTGLWQVSGRSDLSGEQRRTLDVEYVQSWSLRRDVRILASTIPAVVGKRGAH